ncbi:hypothetical protein [Clostridium beijerinckii]|uniref:Uncharacterized protein n=1 Tax=Clostridium beijerinckii TaxID=1520 RepID=A0AAE5H6C1_CLOBE|nr:hypothetical protein [Clostridium beijerinckii]NSB15964.1 hypothetical protein [Clostridium beijerinckii]OOM33292.1 hypothetical protein CLOBE_06300 [Clostridium beijerinckii]
MKRHLKIIANNLKTSFGFKKFFCVIAIFIVIFKIKLNVHSDLISLDDFIKIIFHGPNNLLDNILELLIWSLYQFYLFYIAGDYLYRELKLQSVYNISRLGSKIKWYIYNQLNLAIICLFYYIIGIASITVCLFISNEKVIINNIYDIVNVYFILFISSYFAITVYTIIVLLIKKHNVSLLILIITIYLSIELGDLLNIDIYLPFNQGIISKHLLCNFGYQWSYGYLLLMIILNLFIIKILMVKNDLLIILD